jgi:hypothetical protein
VRLIDPEPLGSVIRVGFAAPAVPSDR